MVLSFEQAIGCVLAEAGGAAGGGVETLALEECAGRVLARALVADRDQPPFRRGDPGRVCRSGGGCRRWNDVARGGKCAGGRGVGWGCGGGGGC